jgi:hypothetical protein
MRQKTEKKKFKDLPSLDKYLIFSFGALLLYTAIELAISTITGISHDTLTTCFFAAFGGETLWCAILKKCKLKGGNS